MKKNRAVFGASVTALAACAIAIGAAGAASAGTSEIIGEATVTLDFSSGDAIYATVYTKNLSAVTAWGTASVTAPDGEVTSWGPSTYAAGEERIYTATLTGWTCEDLPDASAIASGFATPEATSPDWTTGVVTYPDSRVTVIGCDSPPTPTPTPTPSPTGSSSPTPEPTGSETATPTPTPSSNASAAGGDSGDELAATGAPLALGLGLAGATAVGAGALLAARRRRT